MNGINATILILSIVFLAALVLLTMRPNSASDARLSGRPPGSARTSRETKGESLKRTAGELELVVAHRQYDPHVSDFLEQAAVGITRLSLDGVLVDVNQKFCDMLRYDRSELIGKAVNDIAYPDDHERISELNALFVNCEMKSSASEKRFVRKDGTLMWARQVVSVGRDGTGAPCYFVSVIEDISESKQTQIALQQSEEQFRQLAAHIPQVFWIGDIAQRKLVYVSPAAKDLFGRSLEEIYASPRTLIRAVHKHDRQRLISARRSAAGGSYDEVVRVVRPDGTMRWVRDRAFPVRDADGKPYRIAGIAEDITERRESEERLIYLAHYDALTNLPNRLLFYDRLGHAIALARRNQWIVGVMFIDVDRFKYVNDTLGHAVGDRLLQKVSERLIKAVRSEDTIGRLGGDEFAVVLSNLGAVQDAEAVAHKIIQSIDDPFQLDGGEVYVTASIGITLYPSDGLDQDTLLKNADLAMYRAKEEGRNTYARYFPDMNRQNAGRLDMQAMLRRALERKEFVVYYQPRVDVQTNHIVGAEALIRWNSPELGFVSPEEFIPIAEETGLIVPIGEWVLRTACAQNAAWQAAGYVPLLMSVNFSARQFREKNLAETIVRVLDETGLEAHYLDLEITESLIMSHANSTLALLQKLHRLGVGFSIDDFGTGYSSLAYLKRFPVQSLKIDKSFVRDLISDADDAAIVSAIVAMAKSLKLKVIAEGVETKGQLDYLSTLYCNEYQGYYFSRPVPAATLVKYLEQQGTAVARLDG
jgi:diguanylate cyclase (GGDEF)-like protein/PAS domain S-box-containing protein